MSGPAQGVAADSEARIVLRPLCEADEALYCSLYTDAGTMAFIGSPMSSAGASRSFRAASRRKDGGSRFHVIVGKATGEALGICGWRQPDPIQRRVEVGAALIPSARNHGYSVEAVAAVMDLAFVTLPIDMVWVQYDRAHVAADRLCIRLGMQLHDGGVDARALADSVVRSLHRSTWHGARTINQRRGEHVERDRVS